MDPLVFEPYLRPLVWGDRRLEEFGKPLPAAGAFGESWEISAHPQHVSRVAEGPLRGSLLSELCLRYSRELFGSRAPAGTRFPLLIKLLDCHDLLSIQVHPTDEIAARLLPGECGKTEAWVVLDAAPTGRIYAGLLPGTTRAELERHLEHSTADQCLSSFVPQAGACLFLEAGTVHAVGGGVVMVEVQQTSDATFRLFDWNRLGTDGKPRPLHIRQALEAIDWDKGPVHPVTTTPITGLPANVRGEHLVGCRYFNMDRYHVHGKLDNPFSGRLSIWVVLNGLTQLQGKSGPYRRPFRRGETVLIPASAPHLSWEAIDSAATLLGVSLP